MLTCKAILVQPSSTLYYRRASLYFYQRYTQETHLLE